MKMGSRKKLGSAGESHEGSTDDDENEEIYEVEKVIDIKYEPDDNGKKKTKYRVRWKGFGPIDDTWEPLENFTDHCLPVVQQFRQKYKKMKAKVSQTSSDFDINILSEEISQIINKTEPTLKQPEVYYLVRWKGFDLSGNTWEHEDELRHAQNMIDAFNRRRKQGLTRKIKKCIKDEYIDECESLDIYRKIKSEVSDTKDDHEISSSNKIKHEEKKKVKIKKEKLEHEKESTKTDKKTKIKVSKLPSQIDMDNRNEKTNENEVQRKSEESRIKAKKRINTERELSREKEKKVRLHMDDEKRSSSPGVISSKEENDSKVEKVSKNELSLCEYVASEHNSEEGTKKNDHKKKRKNDQMKMKKSEEGGRKTEVRETNESVRETEIKEKEVRKTEVKETDVTESEVQETEVRETEVQETEKREEENKVSEIETNHDALNIVDDYLSSLPDYNPETVKAEIEKQSSVVHSYSKDLLLNAIREDNYQKVFSYLRNNQIDKQDLDYSQLFLEVARCGQRDMALLLATRVPNLSIEDELGDTALCMAARKGDAAFAHCLLVMGVPIQEALTRPKDLAEKAGHTHFILFLNQYAKDNSKEI